MWIAFALSLTILAQPAAAVEIHTSRSPDVLNGPPPWTVTFSVTFDAGPDGDHVNLAASDDDGFLGEPTINGPAQVTPAGRFLASSIATCPGGGERGPYASGGGEWHLDLPPDSQTTVTFASTIRSPLGIGQARATGITLEVATVGADWQRGDHVDYRPLEVEGPRVIGPRVPTLGLQLGLRQDRDWVSPGTRIPIFGHTSPSLAGQMVDIRYGVGPSRGSRVRPTKRIAVAQVRPDGSFRASLRPRRVGLYVFSAFYTSHDPRFLDTTVEPCLPSVLVDHRWIDPPRWV